MSSMLDHGGLPQLPEGTIRIDDTPDGRVMVQIGRPKGSTRRYWFSQPELDLIVVLEAQRAASRAAT